MKILVLLFAALLVAGCGEKSSSEGSDSVGASAEPSAYAAKQVPTESPGKEPSPPSLSDADVQRLLKEAVDFDSLEERDDLAYQNSEAYSGWVKSMYDSGQVHTLAHLKDGKWDGLQRMWFENGQKQGELTYKDGEEVSAKYWNSKGEEVETFAESEK